MAATVGAVVAYLFGYSTLIEVPAFATGVLGVWLATRGYTANFPVGIVNVLLYAYLFGHDRLFGDMTLQFIFFGFLVHGWWSWSRSTAAQVIAIRGLGSHESLIYAVGGLIATGLMIPLLIWLKGAAPFWDTVTTVLSFAAQLMLNRKVIQNWLLWIVANIIYVPLYFSRGFYATSVLYLIFLGLAVMGWFDWKKQMQGAQAEL